MLNTFDDYDAKIQAKIGGHEKDLFEVMFLLRQLYWNKQTLWKEITKQLKSSQEKTRFGWTELLRYKKSDWGVTAHRFWSFNTGLIRLREALGKEDVNAEAKRCGVAVVCLFGNRSWTKDMVKEGYRYISVRDRNAKFTYQYISKYIESRYPSTSIKKKKKCSECAKLQLKIKALTKLKDKRHG